MYELFTILGFGQLNNNVILSFIEDVFFPIPFVISKKDSNQIIHNEEQIKVKQKSWARRVNLNGGYYFLVLFIFSILNAVYTIEENISGIEVCNLVSRYPDEICNNSTMMRDFQKNGSYLTDDVWTYPKSIDYKIFKWALPSIYGHFFFCNVQLMIIVGLCLDGGDSILAKFFNTKPMQASNLWKNLYILKSQILYLNKYLHRWHTIVHNSLMLGINQS